MVRTYAASRTEPFSGPRECPAICWPVREYMEQIGSVFQEIGKGSKGFPTVGMLAVPNVPLRGAPNWQSSLGTQPLGLSAGVIVPRYQS